MVYQTPVGINYLVIRPAANEMKICASKRSKYRSGVGMLLYLIKYSRPDIANSVRELSKVNDKATESYWKSLIRIMKYVVETKNRFLYHKVDTDKNEENGRSKVSVIAIMQVTRIPR